MDASNRVPPKLQVLQIIWVAMCASVVIYGVVAFLVAGRPDGDGGAPDPGDPFSNPLVIVLHLAGFGAIAAGALAPGMLRARMTRDPHAPPSQPGEPFELSQRAMQAMILRFALYETAAVLGLVLALVTGDWKLFVVLGLASISSLLMSFPSEEKMRALDEGATRPF